MVQEPPQELAARRYMERKGNPDARPYDQDKLEDLPCWYFYYHLPDGDVELEVSFDAERQEWNTMVTHFTPFPT